MGKFDLCLVSYWMKISSPTLWSSKLALMPDRRYLPFRYWLCWKIFTVRSPGFFTPTPAMYHYPEKGGGSSATVLGVDAGCEGDQ